MPDLRKIQHKLGYQFNDESWLALALTHRSKSTSNYERLEFLGDSLLGFVISECLYKRFPDQPEGVLTRLRANMVRQKTLAAIARKFDLSEDLILGAGECKSGGHQRISTLSDVLEAIIAAIHLDGGMDAARAFIERTFSEILESQDLSKPLKDPKSRLQEWLQQHQNDVPDYEVINISGKDHKQVFEVQCHTVISDKVFTGKDSNRRKAEQKAAGKLLEYVMKTDANGE